MLTGLKTITIELNDGFYNTGHWHSHCFKESEPKSDKRKKICIRAPKIFGIFRGSATLVSSRVDVDSDNIVDADNDAVDNDDDVDAADVTTNKKYQLERSTEFQTDPPSTWKKSFATISLSYYLSLSLFLSLCTRVKH